MSRGSRVLLTGCVTAAVIIAAAGAGWAPVAAVTATAGLLLVLRGAAPAVWTAGVLLVVTLGLQWSAGWWQLLVPTASAGVLVIIWLDDRDWERRRDNGRQAERRGARGGAG